MIVTLELTQKVVQQFQAKAQAQDVSLEQLLEDILTEAAANPQPTLAQWATTPEAVMAEVRALLPNPSSVIPAQGSLLEALQAEPEDPNFDLAVWNQQWAQAEAEIKEITRQTRILRECRGCKSKIGYHETTVKPPAYPSANW